jgi:tetratricopeptide (TPR) repeat protein
MRIAQHLDPLNQIMNARVGTLLNAMHRYAEAETEMRRAIALDSTNDEARGDLAMALTLQRRYREAFDAFPPDRSMRRPYPRTAFLGYLYGVWGRRAEAIEIRRRLEEQRQRSYVTPEALAYAAMGLGEPAQALSWLEQGYRERSFYLWTIGADPVFDPLHGTPRFERIIQGVGITETSAGQRH